MTYYLTVSYDEGKDEFFAFVDRGKDDKNTMFYINDTQEMVDLLTTGVMSHIDDVDGLLRFLQRQAILTLDDIILVNEKAL
jgi:hypothetical protein